MTNSVKQDVFVKYEMEEMEIQEWKYIMDQPNKDEEASSRPESTGSKTGSPAPSNLITKFARILTEEEKEEQKLNEQKEAILAKQKTAEQACKMAAVKAG